MRAWSRPGIPEPALLGADPLSAPWAISSTAGIVNPRRKPCPGPPSSARYPAPVRFHDALADDWAHAMPTVSRPGILAAGPRGPVELMRGLVGRRSAALALNGDRDVQVIRRRPHRDGLGVFGRAPNEVHEHLEYPLLVGHDPGKVRRQVNFDVDCRAFLETCLNCRFNQIFHVRGFRIDR